MTPMDERPNFYPVREERQVRATAGAGVATALVPMFVPGRGGQQSVAARRLQESLDRRRS